MGITGVGKTLFLKELSKKKQVIDFEGLANHKGSILGDIPNKAQPSQKFYETCIYQKLNDFNNNIEGLIVAADSFDKNKWNTSSLEIPLEIRWRTSTASTYKFWRVYLGLKTSFLLNSKYKFESENSSYKLNSLPLRKIQSGLMLNAGNNTWNLGLYMGLNPIFNDQFGKSNLEIKDLKEFTLGLTFYIL